MDKKFYDKAVSYRTAISVIKSLLKSGLITKEEYSEIDTILTKKYGLKSSTIFR